MRAAATGETHAMARTYLAVDWKVFPLYPVVDGICRCSAGGRCASPGKHPLIAGGVNNASSDIAKIDSWWTAWPLAGIGLPAGDNGLAVLDVDPRHGGLASLCRLGLAMERHGEPMPSTLAAQTGSGGYHLVFAAPEGGIKNGANVFGPDLPGLDTRGRGGYIVAAPTIHASGERYEWIGFFDEMAPWPPLLTALMEPPPAMAGTVPGGRVTHVTGPVTNVDTYGKAALDAEAERVRAAAEGERNHTLNRAAFRLGQLVAAGLLDADEVGEVLSAAGGDTGLAPVEIRRTIRSGLRGGARSPRTPDGGA